MQFSGLVRKNFEKELSALLSAAHKVSSEFSKPEARRLAQIEVVLERLLSCLLFQVRNLNALAPTFSTKVALLKSINPRWALLNSSSLQFLEGVSLYLEGSQSNRARFPSVKELQTFAEELSVQVSLRLALERAAETHFSALDSEHFREVAADYDSALEDLKSILRRRGSGF